MASCILDESCCHIPHLTGNPNYLGEMMLYGSYAILAQHAVPWLVLSYVWGLVFMSNMVKKEVLSLSLFPQCLFSFVVSIFMT
jgi:hypothetical protein